MENTLTLARLLLTRLERISADSTWAHRASGVRGALLKLLDKIEENQPVSLSDFKRMVEQGFEILENAVREMSK